MDSSGYTVCSLNYNVVETDSWFLISKIVKYHGEVNCHVKVVKYHDEMMAYQGKIVKYFDKIVKYLG